MKWARQGSCKENRCCTSGDMAMAPMVVRGIGMAISVTLQIGGSIGLL